MDITEDGLLVNGSPQQEPGIYEETKRYAEGMDFPVTLQDGEVFVLGDAREDATDSRVYGTVRVEDTLGKSNDRDPAQGILKGYSYIPLPICQLCGRNLENCLKISGGGYRGDK